MSPRRGLPLTDGDVDEMERMYRAGQSTLTIAREFRCLPGSIWARLRARGVPMRPARQRTRRRAWVSQAGYAMWGDSYVHRVVAAAWCGRELSPGEVVHHRDGDKLNNHPENLEVLPSQSVHVSEFGAHRPRLTHCKRGHEFAAENVYVSRRGVRECRACRNLARARYTARTSEEAV